MTKKNTRTKRAYGRRKSQNNTEPKKDLQIESILDYMNQLKREVEESEEVNWTSERMVTSTPYNPFTGTAYRGANFVKLMLQGIRLGVSDPRILTVPKAIELGGDFRDQEITWLSAPPRRVVLRDEDDEGAEEDEVGRKVVYKRGRPFRVLFAEQVKGIEDKLPSLPPSPYYGEDDEEVGAGIRNYLMANFDEPPVYKQQAFLSAPSYTPASHTIKLPPLADYKSLRFYIHSMVHETSHATGTPLGRFEAGSYGSPCVPKGNEYAFEELVTEFTTSSIIAHLNVSYDDAYSDEYEYQRTVSYLRSWNPKSGPEVLKAAIHQAGRAFDFLTAGNPLPKIAQPDEDELCNLLLAAD